MDKLVQSRRAMQLTLLACAVVFLSLLMAIIVCVNDHHWLLFAELTAVFAVCVFAMAPQVYAFEERPYERVRLHRPIGVVDLELSNVEVLQRRRGVVVKANGHTYPVLRGVGSTSLINEWLRRAAR